MSGASTERQNYIAEMLYVVGDVKRRYLMRKFKISNATAAKDIAEYKKRNPKAMVYDGKRKTHVANGRAAKP